MQLWIYTWDSDKHASRCKRNQLFRPLPDCTAPLEALFCNPVIVILHRVSPTKPSSTLMNSCSSQSQIHFQLHQDEAQGVNLFQECKNSILAKEGPPRTVYPSSQIRMHDSWRIFAQMILTRVPELKLIDRLPPWENMKQCARTSKPGGGKGIDARKVTRLQCSRKPMACAHSAR